MAVSLTRALVTGIAQSNKFAGIFDDDWRTNERTKNKNVLLQCLLNPDWWDLITFGVFQSCFYFFFRQFLFYRFWSILVMKHMWEWKKQHNDFEFNLKLIKRIITQIELEYKWIHSPCVWHLANTLELCRQKASVSTCILILSGKFNLFLFIFQYISYK